MDHSVDFISVILISQSDIYILAVWTEKETTYHTYVIVNVK